MNQRRKPDDRGKESSCSPSMKGNSSHRRRILQATTVALSGKILLPIHHLLLNELGNGETVVVAFDSVRLVMPRAR